MCDRKKVWRQRARIYLAEAFGGKCTICGYDRSIAAFDYHHVDPENKDERLAAAMRDGASWHRIVEEARKCTLVCCRCHREIHAGVTKLPEDYARFNGKYADIIKSRKKGIDGCLICGKDKNKRQTYCSKQCADIKSRKFTIGKEELMELVSKMPMEEVGRHLGVTGRAVKKRCVRLGIELGPRRGYWQKKRSGIGEVGSR